MPTGTVQFKGDLQKFAAQLKIGLGQVTKKLVFDMHNEVTTLTPVDTGRLRAGWVVGIGEPVAEKPPDVSQSVKDERAKQRKKGNVPPAIFDDPPPPDLSAIDGTQAVFITNNLEYAEAIEDGHSKKAPNGMLKVAIATIEAKFMAAQNAPAPGTSDALGSGAPL